MTIFEQLTDLSGNPGKPLAFDRAHRCDGIDCRNLDPVVVSLLNDNVAEKRRTDPVFGDQRPIRHARMSFS